MSSVAVAYLALGLAGALLLCRAHLHSVAWGMVSALQDVGASAFRGRIVGRIRAPVTRERWMYWAGGALVALLCALATTRDVARCAVLGVSGVAIAESLWRRAIMNRAQQLVRKLEFFIPTVMERLVMAVGAGLDIVPAMTEAAAGADDPASAFLKRVAVFTNGGLALEDALDAAAAGIDCASLKHLSVHLALAYRQGGELIRPLRELSDATQLQYQEIVEEEIAKLPVKAVLPLVLTFAGLIVCFLTIPLIQVGSIVSKVADVTQEQ